ncbi:16S rRNA (guanine(966)-N(2))-methyltransferase RsmD [Psychromicrobium xiongbiense]|uniref:16S rRNA (guanine(966)-N(2))-methyltransferase RsmD n=1 Tax=Psychromicrobium xiongbiense TaxID=3051184 RepID=UPI0025530538|nr:16S rRNA (guanine(966)-N(2))-methyltransferase RsmD [Psychromicrobium sp. YIM S02556]
MSRIIAGTLGGLSLSTVPGTGTRPTTDRVKEALFSRLETLDALEGARVLDLFAGSGALGLESASRGAVQVALVESDHRAAAVCQRNAALLTDKMLRGKSPRGPVTVSVERTTAQRFLQRETGQWDLVFLDPPYPLSEADLTEVLVALVPSLSVGAVVVVERSTRSPEPGWGPGLRRFSEKKYGETTLWFAEPAE